MDKKALLTIAVVLCIMLVAVPAIAQKEQLLNRISEHNQKAEQLNSDMMTTDQVLSARQEQTEQNMDLIAVSDLDSIKGDVSGASDKIKTWETKIDELEKGYQDIYQQSLSGQLAPGDQEHVKSELSELRSNIDTAKQNLRPIKEKRDAIQGRINS